MATVEESVMNIIMGTFAGQGKAQQTPKPSKSYMAISRDIPEAGKHFKCKRLHKEADGKLTFQNVETTTVQKITKLAGNVYVATTRNSYYVTQILNLPAEKVRFALVKYEPQVGAELYCYKLEFKGEASRSVYWHTTTVQEVKKIHGLYKVKTKNSTYVCFPI